MVHRRSQKSSPPPPGLVRCAHNSQMDNFGMMYFFEIPRGARAPAPSPASYGPGPVHDRVNTVKLKSEMLITAKRNYTEPNRNNKT